MNITSVSFDLNRFGGAHALAPFPQPTATSQETVERAPPGPSGPSGPSKKPLLIVDDSEAKKAQESKTIENTGTTRTTGAAPTFRFVAGVMEFGDICQGWTPLSWVQELRRKADRCAEYHADTTDHYCRWAADIEERLGVVR